MSTLTDTSKAYAVTIEEAQSEWERYAKAYKSSLKNSCKPARAWPDTPRHRAEVRIVELQRQFPARPRPVRVVKAPDTQGLAELRWLHQFLDKLIAWRQGWRKADRLVVSSGKSRPLFR